MKDKNYKYTFEDQFPEERMIKLYKDWMDINISTNVNDFDNVDCMMNMSIEIISNNKMIKDYIKPITLRFKDEGMEIKVKTKKK